jgi:uncharacterized membrane protein
VSKSRLEAFSDGVIAIIITIMVLELKVPHEATFAALAPLWPVLLSYVLSFVHVGIYWNNHHHMLAACRHVFGAYWLLQQRLIAAAGAERRSPTLLAIVPLLGPTTDHSHRSRPCAFTV